MNSQLAICAAFGCALFNAGAAVLQKMSSDKAETIHAYDARVLAGLLTQLPYVAGIVLDLLAGLFTLIAVSHLPLFTVEAVIASSVVITAFLERVFLKRLLRRQTYYAAVVVLVGLVCLGLASHGEKVASIDSTLRYTFIVLPAFLAIVGIIAVKLRHRLGAVVLAVLSGFSFGGVSIIGRVLVYPHPFWLTLKNPLFWALVAYGLLGLFFFTAALQRTLATVVNGIMTSTQTVIPLLIGVILLGDTARNGLWALLWVGCVLVTSGAVYISFTDRVR